MKMRIDFILLSSQSRSEGKQMNYRTQQRELILDGAKSFGERHFTAEDLCQALRQRGAQVGKATVYRHLMQMIEDGTVRKYDLPDRKSACYQYDARQCALHYHLKCVCCGQLIHVKCEDMDALRGHVLTQHGFLIDDSKTVLYGRCKDCMAREAQHKCEDPEDEASGREGGSDAQDE